MAAGGGAACIPACTGLGGVCILACTGQRGVCPGCVCLPNGVSAGGMSTWGWCLLVECLPRLGSLPHTPPMWTEWQTPVEIWPCRNYVADGYKQVCCVWDTRDNLPVFCRMLTCPQVFISKRQNSEIRTIERSFFQDAFVSPENLSKQALYFSRLSRKYAF